MIYYEDNEMQFLLSFRGQIVAFGDKVSFAQTRQGPQNRKTTFQRSYVVYFEQYKNSILFYSSGLNIVKL